MLGKDNYRSYQEFSDDTLEQTPGRYQDNLHREEGELNGPADNNPSIGFSKACLKSVFSVLLIFIYVLLTVVALFLAYQTINDFKENIDHPVMSVTFKEVDFYEAADLCDFLSSAKHNRRYFEDLELPFLGITLYPGKAQLLSCRHHHHDQIPPLMSPGRPEEGDCLMEEVAYRDLYTNHTKKAIVVQGPTDVRSRELVFLQFSQNETEEDFSSITYMLFYNFSDMIASPDKSEFMKDCERNYSTWTFSGGFRTWVKMSLVQTLGKRNESMAFRQESSVVKYNDKRPDSERINQLFFVVFEWRDPFIQEIRDIVTANAWNTIAILCGVFMALFKVAEFSKLSVKWIVKIRKAHLKHTGRQMSQTV